MVDNQRQFIITCPYMCGSSHKTCTLSHAEYNDLDLIPEEVLVVIDYFTKVSGMDFLDIQTSYTTREPCQQSVLHLQIEWGNQKH